MLAQLRSAELREFSTSDFRENRAKPTKEKMRTKRVSYLLKLNDNSRRAVSFFQQLAVALISPCCADR